MARAYTTEERCEHSRICTTAALIAAAHFNVNYMALTIDGNQSRRISDARHTAWYIAHTQGQVSMKAVGDAFGAHPTTVNHAVEKIEALRDDADFDHMICQAERHLAEVLDLHPTTQSAGAAA